MHEVNVITYFTCPNCNEWLTPDSQGPVICPRCGWHGMAYLFTPRVIKGEGPEAALPDEATCLYHPTKKATAVCAGTGDYICSLCAVELDGQTFGAEYLNSGGKAKAGKAFERTLPRPDSQVVLYTLLMFIPYVNFVAIPLGFIWIPHGFYLYFKALRLRNESPLFARLMGRGRVVSLLILLSLVTLIWLTGVVALILFILRKRT